MIGYKLIKIGGVYFRSLHEKSYIQMLPSDSISLPRENLVNIVLMKKILFLRMDNGFDKLDKGNWWHVIKDQKENINELPSKVRNQIKNGHKNYYFTVLDIPAIISEGYSVYESAYSRYSTFEKKFSKIEFDKAIKLMPNNAEFIGVREVVTNKLVGFSENFVDKNCVVYVSMWLDPVHMKKYAGYVLIHEMNMYYLNKKNFRYVSDGCRSIGHETEIHQFLISKFGFRRAYSEMNLVYFPGLHQLICFAKIFAVLVSKIKLSFFYKISLLITQDRYSSRW